MCDLFNAKLQEFVRDLSKSFPEVQDFKMFNTGLALALGMSATKPQQMFDALVARRYSQQIIDRDEKFFEDHEFDQVSALTDDFDIVSRVRAVWDRMDAANKDVVWKYLQVLLALNTRCNNAKA